jgi:hypothetical protein
MGWTRVSCRAGDSRKVEAWESERRGWGGDANPPHPCLLYFNQAVV